MGSLLHMYCLKIANFRSLQAFGKILLDRCLHLFPVMNCRMKED
jgi:hypothetical protein